MPETLLQPMLEITYREIEATLASHAPGRMFLAEYARRSRRTDTTALFDAIARLETRIGSRQTSADDLDLESVLDDLHAMIGDARADLAGPPSPARPLAGAASNQIADTEIEPPRDVVAVAEDVQDIAWTMREAGLDSAICDRLDGLATEIYTAWSTDEQAALRLARALTVLARLENRLDIALGRRGRHQGKGQPALPLDHRPLALSYDDIDFLPAPEDELEASGSDTTEAPAVPVQMPQDIAIAHPGPVDEACTDRLDGGAP